MASDGFRSLSPAVQRFFAATIVNMIGSASVFGFVLIYFNEVRGIPVSQAGLAVGAMSFTMVLCSPIGGTFSDRFGARRVLTAGCLLSIVAGTGYAFVTNFASALAVSVLLGVANSMWFPAQSALLAVIVQPHERATVSAFQRGALNIGAALGGALGGFLLASNSLLSYQWLFAINVATYVIFLAVLPGMPTGRSDDHSLRQRRPGLRAVVADRFYLMLLVTDVAVALGFGFLFAFMPKYASSLGIGNRTIGVLFTLGAISVVATQLRVLRWSRGRLRMRSLALMNAWFAAAFALMVVTPHASVAVAIVLIAVGQLLGGIGESLLGAVRQPLTADLAPPDLVGTYYGLAGMVFQACMGLSNALGGILLDRSATLLWMIPLLVSIGGVCGSWALRSRIPIHAAYSPELPADQADRSTPSSAAAS